VSDNVEKCFKTGDDDDDDDDDDESNSVHVNIQRMAEGRLPKLAFKWTPQQRRARGRPKKNWMEGIKKAMNRKT
jgi:hypothetical protein